MTIPNPSFNFIRRALHPRATPPPEITPKDESILPTLSAADRLIGQTPFRNSRWPDQRGYAAIGLHQPKNPWNVGSVIRAAGGHRVGMVAVSGYRYAAHYTDTQCCYRDVPVINCEDLRALQPMRSTTIAVELVPDARPLPTFHHPESAFYIFGPEDGTLDADLLDWCQEKIYIPTRQCMNLASAVHVVLYDRDVKRGFGIAPQAAPHPAAA